LRADAVDHRTDSILSVAVLIGLIGVYFGILWMETTVALAVAIIIVNMGIMLIVKGDDD
jgi:divalent metal cation (Fe/Co/Zn/Cd) transporter